jgi:chromosome segregation ATPase
LPETAPIGGVSGNAGRYYSFPTALRNNVMPNQKQQMEELQKEIDRLKNQVLAANEQIAQLKILNESYAQEARQLKDQKRLKKC